MRRDYGHMELQKAGTKNAYPGGMLHGEIIETVDAPQYGAPGKVMGAERSEKKEGLFTIRFSKIEAVRSALSKLAARAEKLAAKAVRSGATLEGYEPIAMAVLGEPFVTKTIGEGGQEIRYLAVHVRLSGRAPKLGGWQLRATLQHEEAGVIVRALPGTPEGLLAS